MCIRIKMADNWWRKADKDQTLAIISTFKFEIYNNQPIDVWLTLILKGNGNSGTGERCCFFQ